MDDFQEVPAWRAVGAFFFSRSAYERMAYADGMWRELQDKGQRAHFEAGHFEGAMASISLNGAEARVGLMKAIQASAMWCLGLVIIVVVAGALLGRFGWAQSAAPPKLMAIAGLVLAAAWPTFFLQMSRIDTYSGDSLAERMRTFLFLCAFVPGTLLAALGAIW